MRKYLFVTCLSVCFSFFLNAQNLTDQIVRRIIDSTKKELSNAKGNKQIDCLNLLAESYYWIWDENDKHLDTACMYTEEVYKLAIKSAYKQGSGYALFMKAHCYAGRMDDNKENNSTEANYAEAYNYANKAIKLAEEIKDYRLAGDVYDMLKWMERWKGDQEKFRYNVEKAIYYYEKPVTGKISGHLTVSTCDQCQGNEDQLGWLYMLKSNFPGNAGAVRQSMIQKAIYYYQKSKSTSGLAGAFLAFGRDGIPSGKIENSLEYFNKALALYNEDGDQYGQIEAFTVISGAFFNLGDFENGIEYGKKSLALAEKLARKNGNLNGKDYWLHLAHYWMGRFYFIANDMETAFSYLRKAWSYGPNEATISNSKTVIADMHRSMGNYDSAMYYLSFTINNEIGIGKRILSGLYISMKEYDKALALTNNLIKTSRDRNDMVNTGKLHTNLAKAYYGINDFDNALTNARAGLAILKNISYNYSLIENYQLLSDIFTKQGKYDSAYFYLKQYTESKDLLLKKQLYIKLNDYKKEAGESKRIGQINLLQKDNLIKEQELQQQILLKEQGEAQLTLLDKDNELKDQKLKQQTLLKEQNQSQLTLLDKENKLKDQRLNQQAFIRNALFGGLLLFILLGIFAFRNLSLKRKNDKLKSQKNIEMQQLASEKKHAELQQQALELEMQALRAQMNPHFIFNCLSSINRFIFKNDNKLASDYLTRFSRLIRMVLMHSSKKLITLEDELEMLRLYLDLERLRFKDAFDYSITTTNIVDAGAVFIPPLLLQPFCENAVWHGLMHKDSKGHLNIMISEVISEKERVLHCVIEDDGVGRKKAAEFKSKSAENEKSMGLKITTERLALLNKENHFSTFYRIEDVRNENNEIAGTRIQLKIKHKETVEQYA